MGEISYNELKEPDYKERSYNWKNAIGLQQVDGLVPSPYLIDLANQNIEGKISLEKVRESLRDYYDNRPVKSPIEVRQKEADLVSQKTAQLLANSSFSLSHIELFAIHKELFSDIYDFAGEARTVNITKSEWVLAGATVNYGNVLSLMSTLEYDISQERDFDYSPLTKDEQIEHFARFISNIWQVHPFREGNTRATAVFAIKYLQTLGFQIDNSGFEQNSWYFRNALVRANFSNLQYEIYETITPLRKFFGNLLLGEKNELKNRDLHIDGKEPPQEYVTELGIK
jgi:fido (protein-threonine AMPylation protein)